MQDTRDASAVDRWVFVGRSMDDDAFEAGAQAARQAQAQAPATLLVVFVSSQYDTARTLAGICSVTPDEVLVVGGTSMGELAPAGPGLEGLGIGRAVVVTALGGPGFTVRTTAVREASADRRQAGVRAAAALDGIDAEHRVLIMIADGLTRAQHELVRGAYSVLGTEVGIVGGCSADNLEYVITYQFHGSGAGVERLVDSIVTVGLGSSAPIGIGVAHGWQKQGEPMVVTSSDEGEVLRLDDEPALDVYLRRIGAPRSVLDSPEEFRELAFRHPLGLSRRQGEDIRVVHHADPERGSLSCLADVPQGALVWTMTTDVEQLIAAAARSCESALTGLGGAPPAGVLIFDCGVRKLRLGPDNIKAEQAAIARVLTGAPFGGFYTMGEIGRTSGARGMHHLTVVTLALA